jgi:outer membrane protein assembly factor BamB
MISPAFPILGTAHNQRRTNWAIASALALGLLFVSTAHGGDWPQILGPHRDGVADKESLADRWPADGPKKLWRRDAGMGLAGVAVAEGRVVLFHRVGKEELIEAMDAKTGRPLWKAAFGTKYVPQYTADTGPRCVPVIHQGAVYAFGGGGNLHAVSLADGKKLWSRALYKEYGAKDGYFGAGSSPIVEGDKLLVNIGGAKQKAGLVAISLKDGKTIWKATEELASYSSPVATTVGGVRHVIFVTRFSLMSVDPANGKVRFSIPFGKRGPTVNAANPVLLDRSIFVTASYGIGSMLAKIDDKGGAKITWRHADALSSQYTTGVVHKGLMYCVDGRQDGPPGKLVCLDPMTGKPRWSKADFGIATLILADKKLLILKATGQLVLAEASAKGYRELSSARVSTATCRALPALSDGRLYIRDEKSLMCFDVGKR